MSDVNNITKTSKIFCIIGSSFLCIMGAFHGSGFFYISELMEQSNADLFLKDIVPVLFAHPSIHLIGLAGLGVLALFLKQDFRKLAWALSAIVLVDAILGFAVGGLIPGILITLAACCFLLAGLKT